jgi:hypothetical protein
MMLAHLGQFSNTAAAAKGHFASSKASKLLTLFAKTK